ncbi:hypothetical protein JVT61DRAFT_13418 [Boletus reticuloceps]|uniref:Uncharacterized protein n=1 Tax=Boletus reticuloceps TaxID=495285 RepID=A0A8I3A3U5_9AGAM|nr:hypothetical protein JVT61DRAFT_13418 [Boletus reticuloceps]
MNMRVAFIFLRRVKQAFNSVSPASDSLSNIPILSADEYEEEVEEPEHQGIVIIDAGGGTIDLSAYSIKLSPPKEFKEIAPAECRLQGSVFVTQRAHMFLKAKLANSRYGLPDVVQQMKEIFDKTTKLRFRDAGDPQYIKFGTVRDKYPQYDIRSGQLKLAGEDVATFFEPSVEAIADAFEKQRQDATRLQIQIKHAFLVGGYAASDFLYRRLQQHPVFSEVHLCGPSGHPNKAVADGAVSSYVDPLVTLRTSRYTGDLPDPAWKDKEPTCFTTLCTVLADTSAIAHSLHPQRGHRGDNYYSLYFDVILLLGLTELKAQISWDDRGVEKRSPASIVYDD